MNGGDLILAFALRTGEGPGKRLQGTMGLISRMFNVFGAAYQYMLSFEPRRCRDFQYHYGT